MKNIGKKKVLLIFGTRPEAIKMAPLVKAFQKDPFFETKVCVTAQHRDMLDQVLELFSIAPAYDLDIMKSGQTLSQITGRVLSSLDRILKTESPDMVFVHGDTTTTFTAALGAFYNGISVGHVEAGLRSHNKMSPFPEEMNRTLTGHIANLHFAPTLGNVENLKAEGISAQNIFKTGNTVIDAMMSVVEKDYSFGDKQLDDIDYKGKKVILLTAHRRENWGQPFDNIFGAVQDIVNTFKDVEVVFPMHPNPKVREKAVLYLSGHERIHLIEPMGYKSFQNLMSRVHLVLTDSGGIQEEAPALGKPVLVLRTETERPEAVQAGTVDMAGIERKVIFEKAKKLLKNKQAYEKMSQAVNPYGDGKASERIVNAVKLYFEKN